MKKLTEQKMLSEIEEWLDSLSISKLLDVYNVWTEGIDHQLMIDNILDAINDDSDTIEDCYDFMLNEKAKEKIMDTVDIIASEYEWMCPKCNVWNKEIECPVKVKCWACDEEFLTDSPQHALG